MRKLIGVGVCSLVVCAVATADTIELKNGRRIHGEVLHVDGMYVVRQADGKSQRVADANVKAWIAGKEAATPSSTRAAAGNDFARAMQQAAKEIEVESPAAPTDAPSPVAPVPVAVAPAPPVVAEAGTAGMNGSIETPNAAPVVARRVVRKSECAVAFPVGRDVLVTSARVAVDAIDPQLMTRDGDPVKFELVRADAQVGLALLRVKGGAFAPLKLAETFDAALVNGGAELRTCAFVEPDLFQPTAESIACTAERPSGKSPWVVATAKNPVSPGGPILCGNVVVGVQLATEDSTGDAVPAVTIEQLRKFVGKDATDGPSAPDAAHVMMQLTADHVRDEAGN